MARFIKSNRAIYSVRICQLHIYVHGLIKYILHMQHMYVHRTMIRMVELIFKGSVTPKLPLPSLYINIHPRLNPDSMYTLMLRGLLLTKSQ